MPLVQPYIQTAQERHEDSKWITTEVLRFYARERATNCTYLEIMDLWLQIPYCTECITSKSSYEGRMPDVLPEFWRDELGGYLGQHWVAQADRDISAGRPMGIPCRDCQEDMEPWAGDDIYVVLDHVEEFFGIDTETPGRVTVSKALQSKVREVYGHKCFRCGSIDDLHIDHIRPRSRGGDSAFRNLQPLCGNCGRGKGDKLPSEASVYSTMYFAHAPSDSWEQMFW